MTYTSPGAMAPTNNQVPLITKSETEYNMKSIRFLLLTITSMFMVISILMIVLDISVHSKYLPQHLVPKSLLSFSETKFRLIYVISILMIVLGISVYSQYHSFSFLYESARDGNFFTPSIMCVFVGLSLFVISFFGFFGSLKRSTLMVNLYALIILVILIMNLVVVILAFTKDWAQIQNYIFVPIDKYDRDPEIQAEIDVMQVALNCCGSDSHLDYASIEFTRNQTTVLVPTEEGSLTYVRVPVSCCASTTSSFGELACQRLRANGCRPALASAIIQNANVLGVLGVSVMFIKLLGIIFALLLARSIRKMKSERAMMAWKIREQLILARQDDEKQMNNTVYITPPESTLA